jgi:hypothetical protein
VRIRSITAAALAALSLQAHAADLLGDTLTFTRMYPAIDTPFGVWNPFSVSTTVTEDAADTIYWSTAGVLFNVIDPGATGLAWTLVNATGYSGSGDGTFDGYIITGFSSDIAAVSVSSNNTNLSIDLSHTARQISIDLNGSNFANSSFVLSVAVVPEPATWATLTAGLLAIGAVARRRRAIPA